MKMDYSLNLIVVVHQADMPPDGNIAMVAWRRRQLPLEVMRYRVDSLSQILIEYSPLP